MAVTSVQKSSDFDLRDVLWRDIFTIFGFKFVFSPEVDKNCWCFICPKIIWSLRLAQSYLKIILSKWQCVPLLHAWWMYVKHLKRAEHAEKGKFQRKNKSNNQRLLQYWIDYNFLCYLFLIRLGRVKVRWSIPSHSQRRVPGLTKSTAVVKQLINECSTSRLKD